MADNDFFGIESEFSESEKVTDILFSDSDPDKLKDAKKKEEEDAAAKIVADKKAAEEKAKADAAKTKPGATKPEDEEKPIEDVTGALFGETKKEGGNEEETKEDDDDEEDEENADGKTHFELLSESLYKEGIFSPDIDEETGDEVTHVAKTPEDFKKLWEYQKQTGMYAMVENYLSRHGADRQELFDAIFNKGVDPKEYLPVYNKLQDFKSLTTDTEEAQERVVREHYRRNGLDEDKISKKIQRLKDTAELQTEAEDFHPLIVKQDEQALEKQKAEKVAEEQEEKRKDEYYKGSLVKILSAKLKEKEFDGIPLNDKTAQKTFDYLYSKKWTDPNGKKFTDFDRFYLELNKPENHALKIKTALLWQDGLDLTKVQKKAISKEGSELFSELTTKRVKRDNVKKKEAAASTWNL